MDSDLSSVVLACKIIYVKYQITSIFCALYACCQENLPHFTIKVRQLWVDTSRTLKSSSLLCNCLQLFVVCSCYVRGGQNAKPVDLPRVWPLSGPVLYWIKRGTGTISPSAAPPAVLWRKSAVMFLQNMDEQLCSATACQPEPVRRGVCFQIPTGPEVGLELLRVIRAETVGMCPGANLQGCRDFLQFKA